jgi:hypothetical protein
MNTLANDAVHLRWRLWRQLIGGLVWGFVAGMPGLAQAQAEVRS